MKKTIEQKSLEIPQPVFKKIWIGRLIDGFFFTVDELKIQYYYSDLLSSHKYIIMACNNAYIIFDPSFETEKFPQIAWQENTQPQT